MVDTDKPPHRIIERLLTKRAVDEHGCWLFTGRPRTDGYAQVGWKDTDSGRYVQGRVHRIMWVWANGPIPSELAVDHTCHDATACPGGVGCPHRRCFNPAHLRLVTPRENAANRVSSGPRSLSRMPNRVAPTHCRRGHEWSPENTYQRPDGGRQCRACDRTRWREKQLSAQPSRSTPRSG